MQNTKKSIFNKNNNTFNNGPQCLLMFAVFGTLVTKATYLHLQHRNMKCDYETRKDDPSEIRI